jgi:hypothetical protein
MGDGKSKYVVEMDKIKNDGLGETRKYKWWKKGGKAKMR